MKEPWRLHGSRDRVVVCAVPRACRRKPGSFTFRQNEQSSLPKDKLFPMDSDQHNSRHGKRGTFGRQTKAERNEDSTVPPILAQRWLSTYDDLIDTSGLHTSTSSSGFRITHEVGSMIGARVRADRTCIR